MKAVTIRVNDVEGVGGFVLPGDHVDVVLTRQQDKDHATTDVVLQNVRVLAVDQIADERADKPTVAKAVTLEVDVDRRRRRSRSPPRSAALSLMLRKAGEASSHRHAPHHARRSARSRRRVATAGDAASPRISVRARRRSVRNTTCRSKDENSCARIGRRPMGIGAPLTGTGTSDGEMKS